MSKGAPKTINKILFFLVLAVSLTLLPVHFVHSQSISDLEREVEEKNKEINEKKGTLGEIEKRIAEIRGSNSSLAEKISLMSAELDKVQEGIKKAEEESESKLREIEQKQKDLEEKKEFIDEISHELYVETRNSTPAFFLLGEGWDKFMKGFFIKTSAISSLRHEIEEISGDFLSLADARAELEKEKEDLDIQKKDLDSSFALLDEERAKLQAELKKQNAEKGVLSAEITDLNKKVSQLQSALIAARSAGIISSGGSEGSVPGTSISQAPGGSFGVFSIGAYTHRNGMSQWGAKARADAGQSYTHLISVYYPSAVLQHGYAEPTTIIVRGNGNSCTCQKYQANRCVSWAKYYNEEIPFDTYLGRIYEMPASWNIEALKAQAIAARTYALHKIRTQGYIIPNQSNQVYKDCDNAQGWINAVAQTKGQVMTINGQVFASEYAAVHGAWGNATGWDTVSGNGNDWFNDAWEKKSGVNWFYRSWYISGSDNSGETCNHSPYLSHEEMLMMVNGYLIKEGLGVVGSPDKSRLLPYDYGRCSGRLDYERTDKSPYTLAQMQSFLSSPVRSISSVNVAFGNGVTDNVVFYTNRGIVTISGMGFKDIYNQMAPGHMRIQQQSSYAFFNIEKR